MLDYDENMFSMLGPASENCPPLWRKSIFRETDTLRPAAKRPCGDRAQAVHAGDNEAAVTSQKCGASASGVLRPLQKRADITHTESGTSSGSAASSLQADTENAPDAVGAPPAKIRKLLRQLAEKQGTIQARTAEATAAQERADAFERLAKERADEADSASRTAAEAQDKACQLLAAKQQLEADVERLHGQLLHRDVVEGQLRAQVQELGATLLQRNAAMEVMDAKLQQLTAELLRRSVAEEQSRTRVQELEALRHSAYEQLIRVSSQVRELSSVLLQRDTAMEQLKAKVEDLSTELSKSKATQQQLGEERLLLQAELQRRHALAIGLGHEVQRLQRHLQGKDAVCQQFSTQLRELTAELARRETAARELGDTVQQLGRELDATRAELVVVASDHIAKRDALHCELQAVRAQAAAAGGCRCSGAAASLQRDPQVDATTPTLDPALQLRLLLQAVRPQPVSAPAGGLCAPTPTQPGCVLASAPVLAAPELRLEAAANSPQPTPAADAALVKPTKAAAALDGRPGCALTADPALTLRVAPSAPALSKPKSERGPDVALAPAPVQRTPALAAAAMPAASRVTAGAAPLAQVRPRPEAASASAGWPSGARSTPAEVPTPGAGAEVSVEAHRDAADMASGPPQPLPLPLPTSSRAPPVAPNKKPPVLKVKLPAYMQQAPVQQHPEPAPEQASRRRALDVLAEACMTMTLLPDRAAAAAPDPRLGVRVKKGKRV